MTNAQARWDRKWRRVVGKRMNENGHRHDEAFAYAWDVMRAQDGNRPPDPPSLFRASLPIVWKYIKSGGRMNWDWTKTLWKSVRGALGAAAALFVLSFFGAFDTKPELLEAGVPEWLVGLAVLAVGAAISWVRNFISFNFPQWNVVKKAGAKLKGK